jgi:hypothetical protein
VTVIVVRSAVILGKGVVAMVSSPFEPSLREQQVALSLLAHIARHDREAVAASLALLVDGAEQLRAEAVMATLLDQFELGMADADGEALAAWFSARAQVLAAREHAA